MEERKLKVKTKAKKKIRKNTFSGQSARIY